LSDTFIQLQTRLLASHTLTEFQHLEKLLVVNAYAKQKPSDVLAKLSQFCPDRDKNTYLFRLLFLRQLSKYLRIPMA